MGAQLSTVAPTATVSIDAYVAELGDLSYSSDLGRSRFLKTLRATHREGFAVVKVFILPPTQIDLTPIQSEIYKLSSSLRTNQGPENLFPHAIGYSRVVLTERAGYLVRQYIKHNLYDRISTRPFLEVVEKRWIAYQLLRALDSIHKHDIRHGDIKSENVLVGSWKWIYLADFAPFKPVSLPENDTAQFLFYFDVSQRRVCYVSPERFADNGPTELTNEMDIYSAGCVIAELFMDGQPLFSLAEMFKYKRGEWVPEFGAVSEDVNVQNLVKSMVSVDPSERKSAHEYLEMNRGELFPEYFDVLWELLVPYSSSVGATSSNDMIKHLWTNFKSKVLVDGLKVYNDLDLVGELPTEPLPVVVPLPDGEFILPKSRHISHIPSDCGALIVLSYVCSSLTATSSVEWRLKAGYLLLALAEFVPDDAKLDRCLPYLVLLLKDPQPSIRVATLPLITHLMSMVKEYSALNSKVYTAYIFPRIQKELNANPPAEFRAMLASCLPILSESAVECEGWESVVPFINSTTRLLLVDKVGIVRRSLLSNADRLCSVLRKRGTNDIILLHAITYLNDKDPYVRMDLFKFIAKVAPLVGVATIEQYVAPLMMQSLCDTREDLVGLILQSLASMIGIGLIRMRPLLNSVIPLCVKFLIHPNVYIRTQTLILVANTAKHLSPAQCYCLLRPQIEPYIVGDAEAFTNYGTLSECLKPPISQAVYSLMLRWASNSNKSRFWLPSNNMNPHHEVTPPAATAVATFNEDDRRWLASLTEIGFDNDDLWQLLVFRDYIFQLSHLPTVTTPPPSELEPKQETEDDPQPAVTSVVLPNGFSRLASRKGPTSWSKGFPIPPGLTKYIESHKDDDEGVKEQVVICGNKFNRASVLVENPSGDAGSSLESSTSSGDIVSVNASVKSSTNGRGVAQAVASARARGVSGMKMDHQAPSVLVSSMKAHRGAINVLATHINNRHFVTAADDGLLKLWDIRLLLKGSSKPVTTYEVNSPVTACEFLAETSLLAYGTSDSKIGILNFEFTKHETRSALIYNKHKLINEFKMEMGGTIVALHCTDNVNVSSGVDTFSGAVSKLWVLNSLGVLVRYDLAKLEVEDKLEYPREHGSPTCWQWDKNGDYVIVGTLHGMLNLFDMRFSLHVNSFGIGDLTPITAIDAHPMREKLVCVSGGFRRNLVSIWDIEKVECRELLIPISDLEDIDNDSDLPSLEPLLAGHQLNERFAKWNISESATSRPKPPVTAIASTKRLNSHSILTGGGDRILRLWDLRSPYQSVAISGFSYNKGKLSYMGKVGSHIRYTYESWNASKVQERLARSSIISNEEQDIGRNHRGCITQVALLELSSGRDVSVSVDEIGIVKIFS